MRASQSHGKRNFKCSTKAAAKGACIGAYVSFEVLERTVINELNKIIDEHLDKTKLSVALHINDHIFERKKKLQMAVADYNKKISEFEKGIRDLYFDKVKGLISDEDFVCISQDFHREKEKITFTMNETEHKLLDIEKAIENADNKHKLIEQYTNIEKLDRVMVEELIECIFIGRRNSETKQIPIQINWNF